MAKGAITEMPKRPRPVATPHRVPRESGLKKFARDNGLLLVFFGIFFTFWFAESLVGLRVHNQDQQDHGQAPISYSQFITSADFIEHSAENWESEFLEMFCYVLFTTFLFQKGSPESRRPDTFELVDVDPRAITPEQRKEAPWPVRKGGWILRVYENSLSLALLGCFFIAFGVHFFSSQKLFNQNQLQHGGQPTTLLAYFGNPNFWFESFQNWQSEYFGMAVMILLGIWLRQRYSPESKPVHAPHSETAA